MWNRRRVLFLALYVACGTAGYLALQFTPSWEAKVGIFIGWMFVTLTIVAINLVGLIIGRVAMRRAVPDSPEADYDDPPPDPSARETPPPK
jgi:hypothetical protein